MHEASLWVASLASGRIVPISSGKVFVSKNGRELIGLIDEPPAVEGKVLIAALSALSIQLIRVYPKGSGYLFAACFA